MESLTEHRDFAHPQLGREVTAIGGHYVLKKSACPITTGRSCILSDMLC